MNEAKVFFDTNILLYLLSADEKKADRTEGLVADGGYISVQVLNEFAAVAVRKLAMSWTEIREVLTPIRTICSVEPISVQTHDRGLQIAERYRLSIYDSMIVAAALLAGCKMLYSEDMHDNLIIDGHLTVRNPFTGV